jgi:hypothetical protein
VITVVLFCLLFVDSGAVLSLDSWRARRRGVHPEVDTTSVMLAIWPLRLVRFQVGLLYLNAGLWKLFSPVWRDGTALHYALNHNIFHRFPYALPDSLGWLLTVGVYMTLAWEISFAFLLWFKWTRPVALVLGVLVHLGIWLGMEVGSFSWVTVATYVAFLDPDWVDQRIRGISSRPPALSRPAQAGR